MRVLREKGGFTLIEIVVALAIVILLAAALTPLVYRYVEDARVARARAELMNIAAAVQQFERDLGAYPMHTAVDNVPVVRESDADVAILIGPGADADVDTSVTKAATWNKTSIAAADAALCEISACVRSGLRDHLLDNSVGGKAYKTAPTTGRPWVWRGPYLQKLETDPWGQRYYVNIVNAKGKSTRAAFVLSAGPNRKLETGFDHSKDSEVVPGGDDLLFRFR